MTTKKATRPTAPATPAPSVIPAPPEGPIERNLPKNSRIGSSLRNLARTLDRLRRGGFKVDANYIYRDVRSRLK